MKIAILDDYQNTIPGLKCFSKIADNDVLICREHIQSEDRLAELLQDREVLVLIRERTKITRNLLSKLPNLKLISQRSVFPHLDIKACTEMGVIVSSNLHPGTPSVAASELTWCLILAALRQLPQQMQSLKSGTWQCNVGWSAQGKKIGFFGYGRITKQVIKYAQAFNMEIWVWASPESRERARNDGHNVAVSKEALFSECDIVTIHLRLVEATKHIVTLDDLLLMKPTSIFCNTSRAPLVEPGALHKSLQEGRPGMAAIDVYEEEPVYKGSNPLIDLPNVICTPHIGYVTHEEFEVQFTDIFDQIVAYQNGNPIHVVNPEVIK